jgi:hypothetical protein
MNIKNFDQSNMIFVDIGEALDQSKQKGYTMFFTPSKEYARRYAGLLSLNKRPVYVHKLQVKKTISGIRIISPNIIPDDVKSMKLAEGMCGETVDGYVNGMMIQQPIAGNKYVPEYYICNPSLFFIHISSEMQFSPTQYTEINLKQIQLPDDVIE